jgi:membrane fusion protein (multidrug efflux system)
VSKPLALLAVLLCVALAAGGYYYVHGTPDPLRTWIASIVPRPAPAPVLVAPAAPPPEVGVIEARPAEVPVPVEYPGRVTGFRDVEVRPRVGGLLMSREFEEGAHVRAGQILFRIDPASYQVALDRAQAQLEQAQATLRQAEDEYRRIEELVRRRVAAEQQQEEALARRDQARASVQLAQAEVESARLNLGYTTVTAPLSGVTALQSPPRGTLIQAQQTLLTTITQLDPAYVNFSFTDAEGQAFRELNERRAVPILPSDLTVELHFGNGNVYPSPGRIDTAAQRVDPQTGTIEARAIFPNPEGVILPGQFVRVVILGVTLPDAIVVPDRAISQGPQGPSVFVVGDNGTAQSRPVRLGEEVAAGWVVQEGLQAGERVVVDGVIRVRPGAPVRSVPADRVLETPEGAAGARAEAAGDGARP